MNLSATSRMKRTLVTVVTVVLIGLGVWLVSERVSKSNEPEGGPETISVRTLTAAMRDIPDIVWASGTVRPILAAELSPRIMSTISHVYVREGDRVHRGQILVRLEARDLSAQVSSAGSTVTSAKAMSQKASTAIELQEAQTRASIANADSALSVARQQLATVIEGPRGQEKAQAQLAVVQAEAQFRNTENELARMTRLYDQGIVPKQRLEGIQTQHVVLKAQLDIAKQQAEMSAEGGRVQDISAAQERVKQAEEALRLAKVAQVQNKMAERDAQASAAMLSQARSGENLARVQASYAAISAPFSGVITGRYADPGDMASPGIPVLAIADDSVFRLEATIPARHVNSIQQGMGATLLLGAQRLSGTGHVSLVSPTGDPSTRTFIVKVDLPRTMNPKTGDFGRAGFTVGRSQGIVLPQSAIHDEGGILNVFVAGQSRTTDMRIVRTGRSFRDGVEIIAGLTPGDRVITWSATQLADGTPIKVKGN